MSLLYVCKLLLFFTNNNIHILENTYCFGKKRKYERNRKAQWRAAGGFEIDKKNNKIYYKNRVFFPATLMEENDALKEKIQQKEHKIQELQQNLSSIQDEKELEENIEKEK